MNEQVQTVGNKTEQQATPTTAAAAKPAARQVKAMKPVEISTNRDLFAIYKTSHIINVIVRHYAQLSVDEQIDIFESFDKMIEENPERKKELKTLPAFLCGIPKDHDEDDESDEETGSTGDESNTDDDESNESSSIADYASSSTCLDSSTKKILLEIDKLPEFMSDREIESYMTKNFDVNDMPWVVECLGNWFVHQSEDQQRAIVAYYRALCLRQELHFI